MAWSDFREVMGWQNELADLVDQGASKALLMTLLQIYAQYEDDQKPIEQSVSGYATRAAWGQHHGQWLYLGPWLWQMIYRLRRLANKTLTPEKIEEIQRRLLQTQEENRPGGVDKMALSARWAQLVSRTEN
jgi:hypothetical protein